MVALPPNSDDSQKPRLVNITHSALCDSAGAAGPNGLSASSEAKPAEEPPAAPAPVVVRVKVPQRAPCFSTEQRPWP